MQYGLAGGLDAGFGFVCSSAAQAQREQRPNIIIIWGDDIGQFNISAYNNGMMEYSTPNIDRIAKEGALFTDYYGQQSCTAGRAAFITGQSPIRPASPRLACPERRRLATNQARWSKRANRDGLMRIATIDGEQ